MIADKSDVSNALIDFYMCLLRVDRSLMVRQPVSHRRLSLSSALIYTALNRQSSGRGGRANCFDRLPLPATFEAVDDCLVCLALVSRLFFPGPTIVPSLNSYSLSIDNDRQKDLAKKSARENSSILSQRKSCP